MEAITSQNKGSRGLFRNPLLERLTHTHIAVPLTLFSSYAVALLCWSILSTSLSAVATVGIFVTGVVVFTWVEYMVHRHVFHWVAKTERQAKVKYTIHGVHHKFPKDKDRLAMPPLLSLTLATLLSFLFRLILDDLSFSFSAGFLAGYAAYLSVHYMVHRFQPPRNFLKTLWINHSIHHYKNEEKDFGVSSPLWDYICGTRTKDTSKAKS
jgi:sterol desaturase/sphingolipid hydroxylase (fatty acid hydroxylase superfamily)